MVSSLVIPKLPWEQGHEEAGLWLALAIWFFFPKHKSSQNQFPTSISQETETAQGPLIFYDWTVWTFSYVKDCNAPFELFNRWFNSESAILHILYRLESHATKAWFGTDGWEDYSVFLNGLWCF